MTMQQNVIPPYNFLVQVADHCPQSCSTFLMFWRDADEKLSCFYSKEEITDKRQIDWRTFKANLRWLAREGLIDYQFKKDNDVKIHLKDVND